MKAEISVITTVLNCKDFIRESIESILTQTFRDFEYIIVDDGSQDGTTEIIREIAGRDSRIVPVYLDRNIGRVSSLNTALNISAGRYIAIQDADDVSMPERLFRQYNFLEENSDYLLVGSNIFIIDEKGKIISKPLRPEKDNELKFSLLFKCTFANPSIMYRKKILTDNNIQYEENFNHAEDFRLISLINSMGKVHNIKDILIEHRRHGKNNSIINYDKLNSGSTLIVRENFRQLGIEISEERALRIRKLFASKGIDKDNIAEDIKYLFSAVKEFQFRYRTEKNKEVIKTLKRMLKWLGKKNVIMKPEYLSLYNSILTYYLKETFFLKK
ncbi:MAG: glycosyltransferase family 2 protein [Bacteroidetes bacterium]|nr:glycosyltransferase family 2 protein [Bacteroidota bacterium]